MRYLLPFVILPAMAQPVLTPALTPHSAGAAVATDPAAETPLAQDAKLALLRKHIRYVFILFQENRSFDHYFGTYPGADGLLASYPGAPTPPANATSSWNQTIETLDGRLVTLHPFLIPRSVRGPHGERVPLYPEDLYSVDHSHYGMTTSLHLDARTLSRAKGDAFALDNEGLAYLDDGSTTVVAKADSVAVPPRRVPMPTALPLSTVQQGEVAIGHVDCDTIPFLWRWADRFVLFDNFRQTVVGPSTPNAIAMIAAQSGETQWAKHPDAAAKANKAVPLSVPNESDNAPFPGSAADTSTTKPPLGPDEQKFAACVWPPKPGQVVCETPLPPASPAVHALKGKPLCYQDGQASLTFASLPLSMMGHDIDRITAMDAHHDADLADVRRDMPVIAKANAPVPWGWYQQGYGPEPFDGHATINFVPASTPHPAYIVHHNGPQYFGYLGDNPTVMRENLHGLQDFFDDIAKRKLPDYGVFTVRGGFFNNDGLKPIDPNPDVQAEFDGDDDHGSYADSQISEAMLADAVDAIAASPYWAESAIIITYDESDGFYDHVPPRVRSWGPDGLPLAAGPRIPAIVLSPYAAAHTVSHVYSEHGSVIRFIDELFDLIPLAALPDEQSARADAAKNAALNGPGGPQTELGPHDDASVGDLFEAFDNDRLLGRRPVLPASLAAVPREVVRHLPHFDGAGCRAVGMTPTDYPHGLGDDQESDPPPADFNPRPTVSVGVPLGAQASGKSYPENIPGSGAWVK